MQRLKLAGSCFKTFETTGRRTGTPGTLTAGSISVVRGERVSISSPVAAVVTLVIALFTIRTCTPVASTFKLSISARMLYVLLETVQMSTAVRLVQLGSGP